MNSLPESENTIAPGERFIDAALREHARNGLGTDNELVHRILTETVYAPSRRRNIERPRIDRETLWVGSVAVAALIALAIVALSSLPFSSSRKTDEFRLIVQDSSAGTIDDTFQPGVKPKRGVLPFEGRVDPITESIQLDTIELSAGSVLPYIEPFSPSLESFPEKIERERHFSISADQIERTRNSIYYSGHVVVEHSEFRIESDRVEVIKDGSEGPRIFADVARVEQIGANRLVSAESLTFDPVAVEMHLVGVSRFSDGGEVQILNANDTLILKANAYAVESARTIQYASPVKK